MNFQLSGLIALILLSSSCQSGGRPDPMLVPDGRVSIDEARGGSAADASAEADAQPIDAKNFDPRIPILLDQPLSDVALLWQGGANLLLLKENRLGDCEAADESSCSDEEEWRLDRNTKKISHSICRCGKSETKEKVLSALEFKAIEERIVGLSTATSPAPCSSDAPEVTLELTSAQGEIEHYRVNYGQCSGTRAPRIDLDSFERLSKQLNSISF